MMKHNQYLKLVIASLFLGEAIFVSFNLPLALASDEKPFALISSIVKSKEELPKKYTCNGADINPPLEISSLPVKAKSWALTVQNLDAPEGVPWTHWIVYNISPTKLLIPENAVAGYQLLNDFGNYNYSGPCPIDDKTYHFVFHAYALDVVLEGNEGWMIKDLEKAMRGHILSDSKLEAIYRKSVW